MRLAIYCSSLAWGGLEMNLFRLATRLHDQGHHISVYAIPNSTFYEHAKKSVLTLIPISVKYHYFDLFTAYQLAKKLKKDECEVLLFSIAKDNYVTGWAKVFFYPNLHLIYLQQMILGIPKKGIVQTFLYKKLSAWIAPTQELAQQVLVQTHMPKERIHLIPLGIDTLEFANSKLTKEQARQQLNLPESVFLVGIIGRFDPSKGQDILIKAITHLKQEIHILFVGKETFGDTRKYYTHLQELTQNLNLEKRIHFRDFTDEPAVAFKALDVFVMASHAEAFGMVTVEAMASCLPVIGTESGSTPELLENGKLGLLVPPNDDISLAKDIETLYWNDELRSSLGVLAQKAALIKYSYQTQCNMLKQLLSHLDN